MMGHLHKVSRFFYQPSFGLLIVRVATAYIFLEHGLSKVTNVDMPMGMMLHFGWPAWTGFFIAWLEVIGGLALIGGIYTRVFAVAFGIEMADCA